MIIDRKLLCSVESIAQTAGVAINRLYKHDLTVFEKADLSPLTLADAISDDLIKDGLKRLNPNIPILSEESSECFKGPNVDGYYWLVDPLDGTKEFISQNGEFTVNIALIQDGKPLLGVVYAPALNLLYSAAVGVGSFRKSLEEGVDVGEVKVKVTDHKPDTPWLVVVSRSHINNNIGDFLEKLGAYELISMGSSLKFCLVAEGKAHIYPRFGPTSLWDTAAAQCIVEQSGGRTVGIDGKSLFYDPHNSVLNPYFVVYGCSSVENNLKDGFYI